MIPRGKANAAYETEDPPFDPGLIIAGMIVIAVFALGVGLWFIYAPISSVINAPGIVRSAENSPAPLYVESSIDHRQIGIIRLGARSLVEPTYINRRQVRPILGHVSWIAPASEFDPARGRHYYPVHIKLDRASIRRQDRPLQTGTGVDVSIRSNVKSPLEFLLEPVTRPANAG